MRTNRRLNIAVAGTGISGLSAAWLLSRQHDVTVYERADRIGGHSNTILVPSRGNLIPVDTGFIVFNRPAYPNLSALFGLLGVATQPTEMSFAASLDDGRLEYSGSGLGGLFGQPRNLVRPRFWSMLRDVVRFYREAATDPWLDDNDATPLGEYLAMRGYGEAFRDDHLLPMAGAIWSAAPADMLAYPAAAFVRFHVNHGLLQLSGRPVWETVKGGSRNYVARLAEPLAGRIRLESAVRHVDRSDEGIVVTDSKGRSDRYDHIVMAMHADQALAALAEPTQHERSLLGSFRYSRNLAILHSDETFMPKRRGVWSSWNYVGSRSTANDGVCVTYWMNRLQSFETDRPLFVTLNPQRPPRAGTLLCSEVYHHPVFDTGALDAQQRLWPLQGVRNTWYCGAYFGSGFHEDGLQAGLAVAEQLGGVRRPWSVPNQSGRIVLMTQGVSTTSAEIQS